MNYKAKISISIFAMVMGSIFISEYSSPAIGSTSGSPAGRTGSPGDGVSCAASGCHAGGATTQAGLITSDIPIEGYSPGQTYTITGTITTSGKTKFGFQISPQNTTGNLQGSLIVTNTSTTKLVGTGKYITHKSTGTSFPSGTATWSFNWTAPAQGSGALTFYGAFNSSNNNGSSSGDVISLSSLAVTEGPVGIADIYNNSNQVIVYPNPVSDKLFITTSLTGSENMTVDIIDVAGKLVREIKSTDGSIDFNDITKGYYILKIKTPQGVFIKKVVKE
ncbi:MAG: choice-of-anchor V domain-containing protein [Bacteroidota bacterium]